MKPLSELKTFLTGKPGVSISVYDTNNLEFSVNHTQFSRKDLMTQLYQFSGYKVQSTGANSTMKHYKVYV